MLETQVKDVDLASLRLVDPRWPHSQAWALVLAVNWVSWFSSTWSLSLQQDSLGCRRTQAEPVRVLRAQAAAHCFPALLVSEARRKEAGSNAPSMAPSIDCLVRAVVGQALTCLFLVPWWDKGPRRSRGSGSTVQLLAADKGALFLTERCMLNLLHRCRNRYSRIKVLS